MPCNLVFLMYNVNWVVSLPVCCVREDKMTTSSCNSQIMATMSAKKVLCCIFSVGLKSGAFLFSKRIAILG